MVGGIALACLVCLVQWNCPGLFRLPKFVFGEVSGDCPWSSVAMACHVCLAYMFRISLRFASLSSARWLETVQYQHRGGGLKREYSSNFKPTFYPCTVFRRPRPLPEDTLGCRWPARWGLFCILQNGRGKGRQLHRLRFLRSSRQVDCTCQNLQLRDLTVFIKYLVSRKMQTWVCISWLKRKKTLKNCEDLHDYFCALLQENTLYV